MESTRGFPFRKLREICGKRREKIRVTVAAMRLIGKRGDDQGWPKLLSRNAFLRFSTIVVDKSVHSLSMVGLSGAPAWNFCVLPIC
jgi:hypothetical protein